MIVHLIEYRIVPGHEAEITGFLRHVALAASPPDGLVSRFAGRRLTRQGRKHLVATTWRDAAALARGTDEHGVPASLAEKSALLGDAAATQYRVVASAGLGREGARVLRLHKTSIAADAVESWEQRTLETFGLLVAKDGLIAAIAGVEIAGNDAAGEGGVGIVVLTTWTEWDLLLSATGGRLERALLDTELTDLEEPARADHFELLRAEPGPGPA